MGSETFNNNKIKACVIGAGAAGLCAARQLLLRKDTFEFDIYEQTNYIGGTWNYVEDTGLDCNGIPIHSSMYKNLRTNLPLEIMEFPDFPSSSQTSFVHHTEVVNYLHEYAKDSKIVDIIKFDHCIIKISRDTGNNNWRVIVKNLKTEETLDKVYDAIFLCIGKYARPKIPNVNGIDSFKGTVLHSHDYRLPERLTNQRVFVLGAGSSGTDISIEIAQHAREIVLCHQQNRLIQNLPPNITQEISQIDQVTDSQVVLSNGKCYHIDTFLFCTGYKFDYDFLDTNCGIQVTPHQTVKGVYLHLINTTHPTMAIWSIPTQILPFPLFHNQVLFFIKCLTNEVKLPTKEEMDQHTRDDIKYRESLGLSERQAHKMKDTLLQWQYDDYMCNMANIKPIRNVSRKIFDYIHQIRPTSLTQYKNINFKIISQDEFLIRE